MFCVQALNRSLASSFNAVNTLASFGIAYIIIKLASGTISEVKMVSIMLVHNHSDRWRMGICVLVFWAMVVVFCLLTGMFYVECVVQTVKQKYLIIR